MINTLINSSHMLMYTYLAIRLYFDRDSVALPGYSKLFRELSTEGRENADALIDYQRKRGGLIVLQTLSVPGLAYNQVGAGSDVLYTLECTIRAKRCVNGDLKDLQAAAEEAGDTETRELAERFLSDQNDSIKEISDMAAKVKQVETRHELVALDNELFGK